MEHLLGFLKNDGIDVALIQETKCIDEAFPKEFFEDEGYNVAIFGQKTYNGVAIMSKYPLEEVIKWNTPITDNQTEARYIEALVNNGHTVASVYVPNGVDPLSPQYEYKLNFLDKLGKHIKKHDEKFIIGGDFNIALTDEDVYAPDVWEGKICCTNKEREALNLIISECGLTDFMRKKYCNNEKIYSWWNYRANGFKRDLGLRLDYLFTTNDVNIIDTYISKEVREMARPSDHAPVVIELKD
jgi:exodeoxyribonuclease-3